MHPYREPPPRAAAAPGGREELVVYVLLTTVGVIPVAAGPRFGADATLGLLMLLAGAFGLVRYMRAISEPRGEPRVRPARSADRR